MHILLADDHHMFREAMAEWLKRLDNDVKVEHACSMNETIKLLQQNKSFQLLLLDLNMPGMKGISSVKGIARQALPTATVILSADESPLTINACLNLGACGYIPKSSDGNTVLKALQMIMRGEKYSPLPVEETDSSTWSDKQVQLLSCIGEGMSNKEIAEKLHLSEGTVKQYVSKLLTQLGVNNRTQACIKARELLSPTSNLN